MEEIKQALSLLSQKVNELGNALKAKPDVYFGTVDSVVGAKANVTLDGDTQVIATYNQCGAKTNDRVTVIRHGTSLVTVSTNNPSPQFGAPCFLGALIQIRQGVFQLQINGNYPAQFANGTLIAATCYSANSYSGKILIGIVNGSGGTLFYKASETSSTNPVTWDSNDMLLLSYYKTENDSRFYLVSHLT